MACLRGLARVVRGQCDGVEHIAWPRISVQTVIRCVHELAVRFPFVSHPRFDGAVRATPVAHLHLVVEGHPFVGMVVSATLSAWAPTMAVVVTRFIQEVAVFEVHIEGTAAAIRVHLRIPALIGILCGQLNAAAGLVTHVQDDLFPPVPLVFGLEKFWRESLARSEERRVGKECRSRWSPYH